MLSYPVNSVQCGNCVELMENLPDGCIDLVFTSPPYFNAREYASYKTYADYLSFIEKVMKQIHRILSDDGFFVLNTSPVIVPRKSRNRESERMPIPFDTYSLAKALGFKYIDDIIWQKPDGASNRAIKFSHHRRPMAYKPFTVTEYLFVFRKENAPLIDKGIRKHSPKEIEMSLISDGYERTNVWKINPSRSEIHPATFPLELAEKVVSYYSFVNDLVLDPFSGIGTTLEAAQLLNRRFLGFELSSKYVAAANNRLHLDGGDSPALPGFFSPEGFTGQVGLSQPTRRQ